MQPSASAAVVGPTPEELVLISFAKSTINLIASWEALRLAIAHGWGSSENRTLLVEDLVDLFLTASTDQSASSALPMPEESEIESVLLYFLSSYYSLDLEDDSEKELSRLLRGLWRECIELEGGEGGTLAERFKVSAERAKRMDGENGGARGTRQRAEGQVEEDESSSGSDGSEEDSSDEDEMEVEVEVEEEVETRRREEPVVDEDGFQMVQKRGGRR